MAIQKDHVIETALQLLNETGIEGLTMRKLAQVLNVKAASLYWHFLNKQALLEGLADAMFDQVALFLPEEQPWQETLKQVASEIRKALLAHRDGARVFAGTYVVTDNILRVGNAMIEALEKAGADIELATHCAFSILYYILGLVQEEQAFMFSREKQGSVSKGNFNELVISPYPSVWRAKDVLLNPDFEKSFSTGFSLLVSGIEVRIQTDSGRL